MLKDRVLVNGPLFDRYIHYGITRNEFKKDYVREIGYARWDEWLHKPRGFWGSPDSDDAYTWKKFCESEKYHIESLDRSFKFKVSKDARILRIESLEDVGFFLRENVLDQEKIQRCFDGMELYHGKDLCHYILLHSGLFNSWDVDSICIWNPDVVEVEGE